TTTRSTSTLTASSRACVSASAASAAASSAFAVSTAASASASICFWVATFSRTSASVALTSAVSARSTSMSTVTSACSAPASSRPEGSCWAAAGADGATAVATSADRTRASSERRRADINVAGTQVTRTAACGHERCGNPGDQDGDRWASRRPVAPPPAAASPNVTKRDAPVTGARPARRGARLRRMAEVLTETTDGVAVVTLNAPERRNSLTLPMVDEIVAALDAVEGDADVGAVVVTGAPPAFCAGADLSHLGEGQREGLLRIYEGFLRIARSPLPTIA